MDKPFERIVEFRPAFDKRNPDPCKNYGIHGVEVKFILKGEKGAIQFVIYTNWHLPHVQRELQAKCDGHFCRLAPMPADIGYHSYVPRHEGQEPVTDCCERLGGKPCYYDGSSLMAEEVFAIFVRDGEEALWAEMERYYHDWLERED